MDLEAKCEELKGLCVCPELTPEKLIEVLDGTEYVAKQVRGQVDVVLIVSPDGWATIGTVRVMVYAMLERFGCKVFT